jgi:hypothetical protein
MLSLRRSLGGRLTFGLVGSVGIMGARIGAGAGTLDKIDWLG